jgi:hypothetical protein
LRDLRSAARFKLRPEFPDDFGRLSQELEAAVFRIVQGASRISTVIPEVQPPRLALLDSMA